MISSYYLPENEGDFVILNLHKSKYNKNYNRNTFMSWAFKHMQSLTSVFLGFVVLSKEWLSYTSQDLVYWERNQSRVCTCTQRSMTNKVVIAIV